MSRATCERLAAHFERLGDKEQAAFYKERAKLHPSTEPATPAKKK